ncbi:MAG TPA: ABC transporter permease [Gemmatimonadaceae bacterium]|nr:ABC transporter permease [Gemmatimonadaceae bacterium]
MIELATVFLEAAVRGATPLAFAAIGETVTERAGVINIGLEGMIIAGAFGAAAGALVIGPIGGYGAAVGAGSVMAALFAVFTVRWRTDQIITGTAVTVGALGLTAMLYRTMFGAGGVALSVPTTPPVALPLLSQIPLLGRPFFVQPPVTYVAYLAVALAWWFLFRTRRGLALRAAGEAPVAVLAAGHSPARLRTLAILIGGAMGGLGGASIVLAQVGTFAEGMSAGRGFIALAIVALGRWHPIGAAGAALLFGGAIALQHLAQAAAVRLPYQAFLALPYLLTLFALAGGAGRRHAPAALGRPLPTLE